MELQRLLSGGHGSRRTRAVRSLLPFGRVTYFPMGGARPPGNGRSPLPRAAGGRAVLGMGVLSRAGAGPLCAAARAVIPRFWRGKCFSSGKEPAENSSVTPMLRHLKYKIKSTGPITVAEYMREVLTNPAKVFSQLGSVLKNSDISVHLVEVSQKLSEIQAATLTEEKVPLERNAGSPVYMKGISKSGIPISWYRDLQDVPKGHSFYLAHEFFDVLPVHKFQKTPQGWREVLVDIDPQVSDKLRFVLAPCATPAEAFIQSDETRDHVEVCPDAGVIIQELSQRIAQAGGAALIADYGHDGTKTDTFRGFCGHKLHDVLLAPGTADLTADVDFSYLRRMAQGKVASLGPVTQQMFLKNMGIDVRLKVLLDNSDEPSTRQQLVQGYDMLMNSKKMGERFNFFALVPHQRLPNGSHQMNACKSKPPPAPVAGFHELAWR
ncbi:protein arginine methyltransferase NDUFAF7, mitochondrial isoform X2 [Elephas maximus indicus]|uniref:protein arginine methyltransferase NDUFAF7, mitochondrial isoform X2 n=1 Tax=Elephas maximus indicus TaxID=99487 RepID=UPI0021167103|nr:protein arginine methyltransferase NDUFAF7, mitochondrial isoform X2 [Elephas maximus indicus]